MLQFDFTRYSFSEENFCFFGFWNMRICIKFREINFSLFSLRIVWWKKLTGFEVSNFQTNQLSKNDFKFTKKSF